MGGYVDQHNAANAAIVVVSNLLDELGRAVQSGRRFQ
jgi:hypothetical protein